MQSKVQKMLELCQLIVFLHINTIQETTKNHGIFDNVKKYKIEVRKKSKDKWENIINQ